MAASQYAFRKDYALAGTITLNGRTMRRARTRRGLTQRAVASHMQQLGWLMTQPEVSQVEHGRPVNEEAATAFAAVLGLSYSAITATEDS
jgi:transcriptional regulator with XRE-family HTH domain